MFDRFRRLFSKSAEPERSVYTEQDAASVQAVEAETAEMECSEPAILNVSRPTAHRISSLTKDVLIDGAPSSAW